ncbi:Nucleolin [Myotis brandtii]|uniref:Nucleolin n=1 Tax=Myotis brandtii TaxID=109478 RepID=S7MTJ8_MYOBR|nr:Nucleolin [Myotis brandtii]
MVKLAKAGKNQGDPKKMAPPPKKVEEDSEDEEMSDEEDESSGEEIIIPQKKGKKTTITPGKKVMVSPTKKIATGISDVFAKNDLAVVDVRIGVSRKFGYVDFESAEDLEKALEFTRLKVFGNEIKLEKPKGKDSKKDRDARTLLAKKSALCGKVTQDELKEVFEDAMETRLVSKDGKNKGIAYIEFKTEADAEKTLEEKQGTEIDGRSISLYYTGKVKIETIGMERTALGVTSIVWKMPKLLRRPWKMVKLMETKLLWIGPSLRVRVASGAMVEAEVALEAEGAEVDLVAEAGEVLKVKEASEEAEEEEETISHKKRR